MDFNTADMSAVVNLISYLDISDKEYRSCTTIKEFVAKAHKIENENFLNKKEFKTIEKLSGGDFGNYEIGNISAFDEKVNPQYLGALTVKGTDGTVYVVYRGTGDGKWLDNGEGMYKDETIMQKAARDYFDSLANPDTGIFSESDRVIITGHSKGGNEAQFVTMSSKYGYLIDGCYSIDGQGFSKDAIEKFKHLANEEGYESYDARLAKMFSINGDNDYVHDLGQVIIPDDHTYFVNDSFGNNITDFANFHDLKCIINADGTGLNWFTENGEIVKGEQSMYGKFIKRVSADMMNLPPDDLKNCALTIMSGLEAANLGTTDSSFWGFGDVKFAGSDDFVGFVAYGLPLLLKDLILTEEGHDLVGEMAEKLAETIYQKLTEIGNELGTWGLLGNVILILGEITAVMCAPAIIDAIIKAVSVAAIITAITIIFAKITDAIIDFVTNSKEHTSVSEENLYNTADLAINIEETNIPTREISYLTYDTNKTNRLLNSPNYSVHNTEAADILLLNMADSVKVFANDAVTFIKSLKTRSAKEAVNFIRSLDPHNKVSVNTEDLTSLRDAIDTFLLGFKNDIKLINDSKSKTAAAANQHPKRSYVQNNARSIINMCGRLSDSCNRVYNELKSLRDGLDKTASDYVKLENSFS